MLEDRVSVIIPARNEEGYIENTLSSVAQQTYKNLDTIVVSNGSDDRTADVARSFAEQARLRVRVRETPRAGVGYARNLGAEQANGDVFVFLDADIRMSSNMISEIMKKRRLARNFIGVCKGYPDTDNVKARTFFSLREIIFRRFSLCNGLIFCDRETYNYIGGFDKDKQRFEISKFLNKGMEVARYFYIDKAHVIVSMRRYEKGGYVKEGGKWFIPMKEYRAIR